MPSELPIPVSVLTGFLGSGKTTLLNRALHEPSLANTAVIINEFGEVGLDHLFVDQADTDIVELSAGCLCCTIRGDLVDTLEDLARRRADGDIPPFDRVIIETTGLADPAPVLQTLFRLAEDGIYDAAGVVTLVDMVNGLATLSSHQEAVRQVAVADRLVLTKGAGTADPTLVARLDALNSSAIRFETTDKALQDPGLLFAPGLSGLASKKDVVAAWLGQDANHHHHHSHDNDVNRHGDRIRAFTLVVEQPVSEHALTNFIDLLRSAHGPNLLRVKGLVHVQGQPDTPLVLNGVQHIFHDPVRLERWPDGDRRSRIVFILQDMDPQFVERMFKAFMGNPVLDQADEAALTDNPLAVPGIDGPFRP
ncbi:MAG: GTP-binding protein [Pseudomonadota bacterium]